MAAAALGYRRITRARSAVRKQCETDVSLRFPRGAWALFAPRGRATLQVRRAFLRHFDAFGLSLSFEASQRFAIQIETQNASRGCQI